MIQPFPSKHLMDPSMRFRQIVLPLFTSLVLLGCDNSNRDSTPRTAAAPEPASETATAGEKLPWIVGQLPVEGTELEVSPNPASLCSAERFAVEVRWDVSVANPTTLQLWLEGPTGDRKLWVAPSVRQGVKTTGSWMQEGSKVIAVDASTDIVLAIAPITAASCAG
jgi:hypothetical protein